MRLGTKLLLISEIVLLVLVMVILVPVRDQMRKQVIDDMQNELRAIAATAALGIDGDLHTQAISQGRPDTEAFLALREVLMDVRRSNSPEERPELALTTDNIYTFYPGDDGELRFGIMTQDPFLGDPYDVHPHQAMALATGKPYASELYEDDYGQWISAVAPIRDGGGAVVGLLEVNRRSDAYFARYDNVVLLTTAIAMIGLLISSLLGYTVLRWLILRPVTAIHEGMRALGRHDFTHRVDVRSRDEFQTLAETLNDLFGQLNVARSIQSNFFPGKLPESSGYRFACRNEPCDATGGDYLDVFELGDGRVAVLVADVTGHGLGPSLLMASCRSALRALATTGLEPGELLVKLERQLSEDLTDGRFITMVFGVLGPDGAFSYANAGHGPALIVNSREVTHLESHRPPLGVLVGIGDDPELFDPAQSTVKLGPGDRIVLTSDGLSEAQDPRREQFGLARIRTIIADAQMNAEQVVDRLYDAMREHLDGRAVKDDVTMLCVDRV